MQIAMVFAEAIHPVETVGLQPVVARRAGGPKVRGAKQKRAITNVVGPAERQDREIHPVDANRPRQVEAEVVEGDGGQIQIAAGLEEMRRHDAAPLTVAVQIVVEAGDS
ncbi:hypothetical protein SEVIR_2G201325v4 [Setaria viridis]